MPPEKNSQSSPLTADPLHDTSNSQFGRVYLPQILPKIDTFASLIRWSGAVPIARAQIGLFLAQWVLDNTGQGCDKYGRTVFLRH